MMEEVAFSEWPGQPVDLEASAGSCANSWLPAYGFRMPQALLERDDFIGNPDADYFLQGSSTHCLYLETIHEETSDDLRSDSDISDVRGSPLGWLASDSDADSVICMDATNDSDCESDREIACPVKRRRQDTAANFLLAVPSSCSEDDYQSLSRSSSLLQFETLERQCQETSSSTPSIYSQFSYDSLELQRKVTAGGGGGAHQVDAASSRDRDLGFPRSDSDSGESSDATVTTSGCASLKPWRSFDSLPLPPGDRNGNGRNNKISAENLSEDSGYGDLQQHLLVPPSSASKGRPWTALDRDREKERRTSRFDAVDLDVFLQHHQQRHFQANFGVSCQNLTVVGEEECGATIAADLGDTGGRWTRGGRGRTLNLDADKSTTTATTRTTSAECARGAKYTSSRSEPDLRTGGGSLRLEFGQPRFRYHCHRVPLEDSVCVWSVPKDLDLGGGGGFSFCAGDEAGVAASVSGSDSIAAKNWDLADFAGFAEAGAEDMAGYRREGSYAEAMGNRVDLSDDEHGLCYKKRPTTTLEQFDHRVLNVISESISSLNSRSPSEVDAAASSLLLASPMATSSKRSVVSTPNLATSDFLDTDTDQEILGLLMQEDRKRRSAQDITRKSSMSGGHMRTANSTSTSGVSDFEDRPLAGCSSFGGSGKGVQFNPVVSEVNWRDEDDDSESSTATPEPERESSFSLSSGTPERDIDMMAKDLLEERSPPPQSPYSRRFVSQPDLATVQVHPRPLQQRSLQQQQQQRARPTSASQPDVSGGKSRRRGSMLVKKDPDGCVIKAYVDVDGIQYRHSHLDLENVYKTSPGAGAGDAPPPPSSAQQSRGHHVPPPPPSTPGAPAVAGVVGKAKAAPVASMESDGAVRKSRAAKLGGFFSRLASFRFSNRKAGPEDKGKPKKKHAKPEGALQQSQQHQRIATKDDYIYIPLKGPENTSAATATTPTSHQQNGHYRHRPQQQPQRGGDDVNVSWKPPLPKAPPRVVGASVKREGGSAQAIGGGGAPSPGEQENQQQHNQRQRRRRTIDSAESCCPRRPMEPMGLIETDIDTQVTVITSGGGAASSAKTRSLLDLGAEPPRLGGLLQVAGGDAAAAASAIGHQHPASRPHKSMEFLLDKQNLKVVEPPENELQKGERVMSEHQLRVQRSLQKLTIPDWYKQSQVPREGFLLKKQSNRESRWMGTSSKTTSLSSLGSSGQSPVVLSPTGAGQPFVRWSTSKLNSTASSPCASTRSSFNCRQPNGSVSPAASVRSSFSHRQPYMGWRSQERLSKPRTPAERLANSLLGQSPGGGQQHQQGSPEIQTSIKEVTSAIVHYVSGLRPENARDSSEERGSGSQRSRSASPRGSQKLCWLESSFVGIKPLDSPQTPVSLTEGQTPAPPTSLRLELQTHNDVTLLNTGGGAARPSPGSTTLEDVLDSLLGLPSSDRAPSPSLQATASASTSPSRLGESSRAAEQFRRRSEGNEPAPLLPNSRRVSFQASPVLQCRYSRCGRVAIASSSEAAAFKNCHNCSYTYCSKECRRNHWEKHRKTCLFSRIGSLCRQVIASIKDRAETLLHLSTVARRGFLSHGQGAVKCFFPCPEEAERFLRNGLACLGELTYVRWPDLLPSEMGAQLYTELVQMCKSYNPDTKLVLYVSVCVVSETPASGAVKWERQLVSRCAKMRLSKDISVPERDQDLPETLVLTCSSLEGVSGDATRLLREITVDNVQKQLQQRGVSLKRQHPTIFRQLCAYASATPRERFTPITVYPKDLATGKSFMCIIMLEADAAALRQVEMAGVRVRTVDVLLCD